jgi:hypothetical protein
MNGLLGYTALKMEAVLHFNETTRRYIAEGCHLHTDNS